MTNKHLEKELYSTIFDLYKLKTKKTQQKETIRKYVRKSLEKNHPNKSFDELNDIEKMEFTHVILREYLLDKSREEYQTAIQKRITSELNEKLHVYHKALNDKNEKSHVAGIKYCEPTDSEDIKKDAYKKFSKDIKQYYPNYECPSFESWEKHCFRIYDIIMSDDQEYSEELADKANDPYNPYIYASQAEINSIVLKCILKHLNINVDIKAITESIEYTKNFQHEPFDGLPFSDESIEYIKHEKKLENLDFFK